MGSTENGSSSHVSLKQAPKGKGTPSALATTVVVAVVAVARREPPGESFQPASYRGSGKFLALCGASFNSFNYICGLDRFSWLLKFILQRVISKGVRNICGHCGFPPGLQEE